YCLRLKKCSKSADCFKNTCCVQVLDSTFAKPNLKPQCYYDSMYGPYKGFSSRSSYGNSDSYSYDHIYSNNKANDISSESLSSINEGYCLQASSS
ncbi:hypothetical protein BgiMline_016880, partial [Biomphalaria glabrata]